MSGAGSYRSDSQQRILQAVEIMATRPLTPWTAGDLAERLECSRDQAFRTARNLEAGGWAWEAPGGAAWRLAPRVTQIAESFRLVIAELHATYLGRAE